MKSGLRIGQSAEIEVTVTEEMQASFGREMIHNLYSTSWLVHHMEWASRKLIEPYLEPHEEGMGSHVEVSHLMLTLTGMKVRVKAVVYEIRDKKIVCEVEAFNIRGKIGKGTITQSIVEKTWLDKKKKEMSIINQLASETEPAPK
jgi:fluoroacetyl-CoA thioesterase